MWHRRYYRQTERGPASIEAAMDRDSYFSDFFRFFHIRTFFIYGGVTLEAVMAQLQRMDARLDTLSDELCQVNTRVGRIARLQARLGGFIKSLSPFLKAFEDKDNDGDSDKDKDASFSSDDEMTT